MANNRVREGLGTAWDCAGVPYEPRNDLHARIKYHQRKLRQSQTNDKDRWSHVTKEL